MNFTNGLYSQPVVANDEIVPSSSTSDLPTISYERPRAEGKFVFLGRDKFFIKGVSYGTFRVADDGSEFRHSGRVERDMDEMSAHGVNAIRTYTVPPPWFLDAALTRGLRVMVGIPWEQHVTFLDDRRRSNSIEQTIRRSVRRCAGHPAVLCFFIGNEIPASIVRWHGPRDIENFLRRLFEAAKDEDPSALVTYANYPSTEYLRLDFTDLVAFNVYLESQQQFEQYLRHLQPIASDRPLILSEVGLDSRRNGVDVQARTLDWQIRTAFAAGCAGITVFGWTDEWHRGGHDILDWDFGLTRRDRSPKPSLERVRESFSDVPFQSDTAWPQVTVAICARNAAGTIRETIEGCLALNYSGLDIVVVDDGSVDNTPAIASEYPVRLIRTVHGGLSRARNVALRSSNAEYIAYIDADAYPDPDWLKYIISEFRRKNYVGVGGPNIGPYTDSTTATCVSCAPGNPTVVLLSDNEAEHIPGCNMVFRRSSLLAIGGFDEQFHAAGDDVDLCWRLRDRGWKLGFSPAAVVWHHRRDSVRGYWRQQKGYGKAEGMLEKKWPERYNPLGHLRWDGALYGESPRHSTAGRRWRVYYGMWGQGLFQSLYGNSSGMPLSWPLMPEWYFVIAGLVFLSGLGLLWRPMLVFIPFATICIGSLAYEAARHAGRVTLAFRPTTSALLKLKMILLTCSLHVLQPLARLIGRIEVGLTPWRRRNLPGSSLPRLRTVSVWNEHWKSAADSLLLLEQYLKSFGALVVRGGEFDRWDFEIRTGMTCSLRVLLAIEEHGAGKQMLRFRAWPVGSKRRLAIALVLMAVSISALVAGSGLPGILVGSLSMAMLASAYMDGTKATSAFLQAIKRMEDQR